MDVIIATVRGFRRLKRVSIVVIVRTCDLMWFGKECGLVTRLDEELRKIGFFIFEEAGGQEFLDIPKGCSEITMVWKRV